LSIGSISQRVYGQTRYFFKYIAVAKSDNKKYAGDATVSQGKILRRLWGLHTASRAITSARRRHKRGRTPPEYGEWLYSRGARAAGNCQEMCCVALYFFTRARLGTTQPFPVNYIGVRDLGDHAFLIAGYLPSAVVNMPYFETSRFSVLMLCNAVPAYVESYVVDPWAGIFCHTRMYPFEFLRKMRSWGAQGKEVWWGRAWRQPGEASYVDSFVNSRFYVRDVLEEFG